jgi:hypothetical protein
MYFGPSDKNSMLGDKYPLRYILLNFMSYDTLPMWKFLSIPLLREREGERKIKRTHEHRVYHKNTTLVMSSTLLRIGTSLRFLYFYYFVDFNHQFNFHSLFIFFNAWIIQLEVWHYSLREYIALPPPIWYPLLPHWYVLHRSPALRSYQSLEVATWINNLKK